MLELFRPLRETWLFRVNPALKFVLFLLLLLVVMFTRNLSFVTNQMVFAALLLFGFSGYSWRRLLLFSLPILLSAISSAMTMILFGRGAEVWWSWGLIKISQESVYFGLLLGMKAFCIGFFSLTFLLTTRPIMLFYALMQQLRLPAKYAYSFIAAIRLMPMVGDELQTRGNALRVRGVHFSSGLKGVYQRLRMYTVPLFAQSIRRAQRVAVAMEAKRFQMGAKRTYYYPTSYSRLDAVFVLLMLALFVAAYLLAVVRPISLG